MPFSEKENDGDPTRRGPLVLDRKPATRMQQMTMKRISYPRRQSPDVTSRAYMFLGQIVEWIICRGRSSDSVDMGQKWDAAERELFDYLDTESVKVEGYPVDGRPRIYESLPAGIWAKMNRDDNSGLMFSPIDDTEELEDGGTVFVGDLRWDGVRLATNLVMKQWPPDEAAANADEVRAAGHSHSQLWEKATGWLSAQVETWRAGDGERLSRTDVEHELKKQFDIRSPIARQVWEAIAPPEWRVRGRHKKTTD
jgi:hypothetical protein